MVLSIIVRTGVVRTCDVRAIRSVATFDRAFFCVAE
jgi:hypothetical protein